MPRDDLARTDPDDDAPASMAVRRSLLLYRVDPERYAAALTVAKIVRRCGATGAELSWSIGDEARGRMPYVRVGRRPSLGRSLPIGGDAAERAWFLELAGEPSASPRREDLVEAWACVARLEPDPAPDSTGASHELSSVVGGIAAEGAAQGWSVDAESARAAARCVRAIVAREDVRTRHDPEEIACARSFASALADADLGAAYTSLMRLAGRAHDRNRVAESVDLYRQAYELATARSDTREATQAARYVARSLRKIGRTDQALTWYGQAAELARFDRDDATLVTVLDGLARTHLARGATPKARAVLEQARAPAFTCGDPYALASYHMTAAYVARLGEDLAAAAAEYWRALRIFEEDEYRGQAALGLGTALMDGGQLDAAERAYLMALLLLGPVDEAHTVLTWDALAYVAAVRGDEVTYERRYRRVESCLSAVTPLHRVQLLFYRARSLTRLGRSGDAAAAHQAAIAYARDHGFTQYSERARIELERLPNPPAADETTPRILEWLEVETAGVTA